MDTIKFIKGQIDKAISIDNKLIGLEDVLTHIERAEHLLELGNTKEDEHYFTDVIYRTNHAYEGILKEAYNVLTGLEKKNITPNNIEKYLLEKNILNERVIKLLENYRKEWRNTSTHDYKLFFNGGEAFLSILSVTSFIHLLLTQILDRLFYNHEIERIKPTVKRIKSKIKTGYQEQDFAQKINTLLKSYDGNLHKDDKDKGIALYTEREYIQGIAAHISLIDKDMNVFMEPIIDSDKNLRPDMLIEDKNGNKAIVELKVYKKQLGVRLIDSGYTQILSYITKAKIKTGFVIYLKRTMTPNDILEDSITEIKMGNDDYRIFTLKEKSS